MEGSTHEQVDHQKAFLGVFIALSVSAGFLTAPAKAADQVTLTIWTFGEVIQPGLQREYQNFTLR